MSRRKQLNPKNLSPRDPETGPKKERESPEATGALPVEADGDSQSSLPKNSTSEEEGTRDLSEEGSSGEECGEEDGLEHSCAYCPQTFTDMSTLAQHEQVHALLMPYQCRHCGKGFKHKRSQDRHEQLHTGNKKHKCHQCQAAFFRSDHLKLHLKTHDSGRGSASGGSGSESGGSPYAPKSGGSNRCSVCGASFSCAESLLRHLDKEHPSLGHPSSTPTPNAHRQSSPSSPLVCRICSATLRDVEELQEHTLEMHTVQDVGGGLRRQVEANGADPRYSCSHCTRSFDSILSLHSHANAAHPDEEAAKSESCPHCPAAFPTRVALASHVQSEHATTNSLACPICHSATESQAALDAHLLAHFLQHQPQLTCGACKAEFSSRESLERHQVAEHVGTLLKCLLCSHITANETDMTAHMRSSHGQGSRDWRCRSCNASFDSESGFRVHVEVVHLHRTAMPFPFPQPNFLASPTVVSLSLRMSRRRKKGVEAPSHPAFRCSLCGEAFNVEFLFERHLEQAHSGSQPYAFPPSKTPEPSPRKAPDTPASLNFPSVSDAQLKCNICDATEDAPEDLRQHKLTHCKVRQSDKCLVCHGGLEGRAAFLRHTQAHSEEGAPVSCIVCRQSLASPAELTLHADFHLPLNPASPSSHEKMEEESQGKPYQCIKCQASFATEAEIQAHVISSHVIQEGLQNQCNLCQQVLDSPAKLQCHLIEHSFAGCSEFRCYLCNSVFSMPQPLREHILSHPASSKPYDCPDCSLRFFFRSELHHHVLTHGAKKGPAPNSASTSGEKEKEHPCPHCPKAFASLSALQGHSHVHMNSATPSPGSHPCPKCPKTFHSSARLRAHLRQGHSPDDAHHLHSCPVCSKAFSRRDNLKVHMRLHSSPGERLDLPTMVPFTSREGIAS